jgi:hypothetical protein
MEPSIEQLASAEINRRYDWVSSTICIVRPDTKRFRIGSQEVRSMSLLQQALAMGCGCMQFLIEMVCSH